MEDNGEREGSKDVGRDGYRQLTSKAGDKQGLLKE